MDPNILELARIGAGIRLKQLAAEERAIGLLFPELSKQRRAARENVKKAHAALALKFSKKRH